MAWDHEKTRRGERWTKIEWEGVRGNSLIASLQYGGHVFTPERPFNTDGVPGRMESRPRWCLARPSRRGRSRRHTGRHAKGSVICVQTELVSREP